MIIPCELVLKDCLPCNDSPIENLTAEDPDVDVFVGFRNFKGNPPLGVIYAQLGCLSICFSQVSQREADDCARRSSALCAWRTWQPPRRPAIPPGPGGKRHGTNTPGDIPPNNPRSPVRVFRNRRQTCDVQCPDGQTFTGEVAAGTVVALTQIEADEKAKSLACKRAILDQLCFITSALPSICLGDSFNSQLQATGGTTFSDGTYEWNVIGSLPPGLDLDSGSGLISGTPLASGNFTFDVEVIDARGVSNTKTMSICVMEIVTGSTLPEATNGTAYMTPLVQDPATVSSEVWTLVGGTLPPGITLASNGALSGTPTEEDTFMFTLKCDAECNGAAVSCTKSFSLEVVSGVDCMGEADNIADAAWTQISPPAAGTIAIAAGDGVFTGVDPAGPFVEATAQICNPSQDAYDFTLDISWTVAGFVLVNTQAVLRLNGVDHPSPVGAANGNYNFQKTLPLPSGVNTVRIYCTATGIFAGTLNGFLTVRPLTPP